MTSLTTGDAAPATSSGPHLFARYALPPNLLGYCGPHDTDLLAHLMAEATPHRGELTNVVWQFDGAYPYLELLAAATGHDPLDRRIVEAYWTGHMLLEDIDTLIWGNAVDDRFRPRAGDDWNAVRRAIVQGGLPTHAFHVFCVYPWVGLLRSGATTPALDVMDRCRISWGEVVDTGVGTATVRSRRLAWVDDRLELSSPRMLTCAIPPGVEVLDRGDAVSLHWDTVCERLSPARLATLRRTHDRHLAIANAELRGDPFVVSAGLPT